MGIIGWLIRQFIKKPSPKIDPPFYSHDGGYWEQVIPDCCPPEPVEPKREGAVVPQMLHVCPECGSRWGTMANGGWFCHNRKGLTYRKIDPIVKKERR